MLILTDLPAWDLDPLDVLVKDANVQPRLTPELGAAVDLLGRGMFGADAAGRVKTAVGHPIGGWTALAVVDQAPSSQYDSFLEAARRPAPLPGPMAALALCGDGFHGNRGRPWLAPRGNLHLSCTLPVDLDLVRCAAAIPAIAAVAVHDALAAVAPGLDPRLKWINDVVVDGAKIAGVLAAAQTRGHRLLALTFGIGVNLAVSPPVEPTLFVPEVTCLHAQAAGRGATLGRLVTVLLTALWARLQELQEAGSQPAVAAYRRACGDVGRHVRVWAEGLPDTDDPASLPPPLAAGRVLGLDDQLALHVEGAPAPLVSGRMAHLDAAADRREPRS